MTATPPAPSWRDWFSADPCPRVEVTIHPMPSDAATVTVWRNYLGGREVVRGASGAPVAGDFLVVDYEMPLISLADGGVVYTCQTWDAAGVPSVLSNASAAVDMPGGGTLPVWAQDPLDPSTSMPWPGASPADLVLKAPTFGSITWSAVQSLSPVVGSPLPIGMTGVRRNASAVPITMATTTREQIADLTALLNQAGGCLLIRQPGTAQLLPPNLYVQIGDVTAVEDFAGGRVVWSMTGTSIQPPSTNVIVPIRTYADLPGESATYAGLAALYATYLDLQRGI